MTLSINEVRVPKWADDADWVAYCQLVQMARDEQLGAGVYRVSPEAALQSRKADQSFTCRQWLARLESRPVGFASLDVNVIDEPEGGFVTVFVDPQFRRRGIGRQLANRLRSDLGEQTLRLASEISTPMPDDQAEVLASPTGFGAVPADHPGVRLALSHGFRLGQVGRTGHYEFANPAVPLAEALAKARAAAQGYEVLCFEGVPPKELRADIAVLKGRMSLDEPLGEMPRILHEWDEARVVDFYSGHDKVCRVFIAVAIEQTSGRAVAINELLSSRALPENPVYQWDTLVLPEHRGRRLGMLVKAANLQAVRDAVPEAWLVTTFNAAENQPMLAVNEALGFRTHHLEGAFSVSREKP
ncbi:MAG: GNAT family N-acetyltransferase [Propionibacteriaceae bacterium]|nr:GNAT family N-acetyltransferase [Propionibacteriaceae bacterium]